MKLSETQIEQNWNKLIDIISQYCPDNGETNRWSKVLSFHQEYTNRIALMPASTKDAYHGAFIGGYVQHVLNVYSTVVSLKDLWKVSGAKIDFSDESLAFVALFHDLGKFGTVEIEGFSDDVEDWEKKRGIRYKMGPGIQFMKDADRSIFLLQQIGAEMSESEYLAIKLHAGLFEESNKSYYNAFSPEYKLQSNLPFILHQADWMCARIESEGTLSVSDGQAIQAPAAPAKTTTKVKPKPVVEVEEDDEDLIPAPAPKPKDTPVRANRFSGRI